MARLLGQCFILSIFRIVSAQWSKIWNSDFIDLSLAEVEKRLTKLKQEKGNDLYVKIIIPTDSGLTYNEAWEFMRKLLAKYDYYYQEN